jgi:hypothetical protein
MDRFQTRQINLDRHNAGKAVGLLGQHFPGQLVQGDRPAPVFGMPAAGLVVLVTGAGYDSGGFFTFTAHKRLVKRKTLNAHPKGRGKTVKRAGNSILSFTTLL